MPDLPSDIYQNLIELTQLGESLFETMGYKQAYEKFEAALELIPHPKSDWEASTWVYTALGDCLYQMKQFQDAANKFYDALNCPNSQANPFIHLRLGQSLYELNDFKGAEEFLFKSYMLEGKKIFHGEEAKFINFLKKKYNI